jgi:hypothetical protein
MGQYLYGASNVDLNERGYLKRRKGTTTQVAGVAHSLWGDAQGSYVVVAGSLWAYTPPDVLTLVRPDIGNARLSYSRGADNDVYWSNGQLIRRIASGVDRPVANDPPNPMATPIVGAGALAAGTYLLATTIRNADGESPASTMVAIQLPAGSSITIVSQQNVSVYMSAANGDVLTLQGTGTEVFIATHNENASRCMVLDSAVMPPGQIVRHYRGSMLVAGGNTLYISDPYNYGIYNPSKGYIPFPAPITVVEPMDNGVWICADHTYWIGDLQGDALQEVYPQGAVLGTSGRMAHDESVFWQSQHGLIIADKNMGFKNVQEDALRFPEASSGASLYRERDGMTHIVTTRFGVETSNAAADSFMSAEIIRKGTKL